MPKGRKTGGRKPGTPNKVTTLAREAFLATFHRLAPDLEGWINQTAKGVEVVKPDGTVERVGANPAKAAELLVRMAEYHYPKQSATQLTGADGGPLTIEIVKYPEPK